MLSLCCHNIWHPYLHFAETLAGSHLVPAVFCFLERTCFDNCPDQSQSFLTKHIFPVSLAPSLHCIELHHTLQSCSLLSNLLGQATKCRDF